MTVSPREGENHVDQIGRIREWFFGGYRDVVAPSGDKDFVSYEIRGCRVEVLGVESGLPQVRLTPSMCFRYGCGPYSEAQQRYFEGCDLDGRVRPPLIRTIGSIIAPIREGRIVIDQETARDRVISALIELINKHPQLQEALKV